MPKQHPMPLAGTYSRVEIGKDGVAPGFHVSTGGIRATLPSVMGGNKISKSAHQPKFSANGIRQGSRTPSANLRDISGKRFFRQELPVMATTVRTAQAYDPSAEPRKRSFGSRLGTIRSVTDDGGWEREYAPIRKPRLPHEPRSANGRKVPKVPTYQRLGDVKRKLYGGPLRPPVQIQAEPVKAR